MIKRLYWDLKLKEVRFDYVNSIVSKIPGFFGNELRSCIIPRYFKKAGEKIKIFPGVEYRGIKEIIVGDNVTIGNNCFIQASGGLTIGSNTLLGPGVMIWTVNHRSASIDVPILKQGYDYKPVTFGSDVWLGANTFIMPGTVIEDGCIISACAVVG